MATETTESQASTPQDRHVTTSRSKTTQNIDTSHRNRDRDIKPYPTEPVDDTFQGLATPKIILLLISSFFAMMLVALDRTIVTTVRIEVLRARK
jgi:hypothetical protein